MTGYSLYSYLFATCAYCGLLLLTVLKDKRQLPLSFATLASLIWCLAILRTRLDNQFYLADTMVFETIRNASWVFFLIDRIPYHSRTGSRHQQTKFKHQVTLILFTLLMASIESFPNFLDLIVKYIRIDPRFASHLLFAIVGMILVEQWYRNTPLGLRWEVKFLCIGLSTLFMVDFLVFSKSLLYKHLDFNLWQNRGFINAIASIFLMLGTRRLENTQKLSDSNAPRKIIFHTTILFGCGVYLLFMSLTGFYLKEMNAEWGENAQTLFISLALVLMVTAFTSGKIRALAKIYFNQHFFHYSYDYRSEWLKISHSLAQLQSVEDLQQFILRTLRGLVDSSGGGLWVRNEMGHFTLAVEDNLRLTHQEIAYLQNTQALTHYLNSKKWVIDFIELTHSPETYDDIDLSPWCDEKSQAWLIAPLLHLNHLEAFAVLTQPLVTRRLNWEDHDLLKTVGMQLANALALSRSNEELAKNKQFEAYHRLSAFLVHDLKNLTAQLSMIVTNANRHKHNPAFIDDALVTLDNAVNKMHKMVDQLKKGKAEGYADTVIELNELLIHLPRQAHPHPPVEIESQILNCQVHADKMKLLNILTNLVQNAQEATLNRDDIVRVTLSVQEKHVLIKIIDNGKGMDHQFIKERLFKPFDTTKGNAGMGIGAYEARDYILKCNGQLSVDSEPEKGTTFTIQLPRIQTESYEST